MRRLTALLTGFLLLASAPGYGHAFSLFEDLYRQAQTRVHPDESLDAELVRFVRRAMESRIRNPVELSDEDVRNAVRGNRIAVCGDRFVVGCEQLIEDIVTIVDAERETQRLADELLMIAGSAELAHADEPHRPLSAAPAAHSFTALWSGTGSVSAGWPDDEDLRTEVQRLIAALEAQEEDMLPRTVMRFHFGLLRGERESGNAGSVGLSEYGQNVADILWSIAGILDIREENVQNEQRIDYATPRLGSLNVALWARDDDLGLHFIYPVGFPRFDIALPDEYPVYVDEEVRMEEGAPISYPFRYDGPLPYVPEGVVSPLCSRPSARHGYLCRPIDPIRDETCEAAAAGDAIRITTCEETRETAPMGPLVCDDEELEALFSIEHPVHGALTPDEICTPRARATFPTSLVGSSCYVAYCLRQSMSGHTLVGSRNPIAIMEPTAPYLSCMRDDPQLGMYAELPAPTASVLPPYIGHDLVRMFDRGYCEKSGRLFAGVPGLCALTQERRYSLPFQTFHSTVYDVIMQETAMLMAHQNLLESAPAIGQRAATEQSLPLYRALARSLSQTIRETADLLAELENAPLTTTACPWNGPLPPDMCGTPLQ